METERLLIITQSGALRHAAACRHMAFRSKAYSATVFQSRRQTRTIRALVFQRIRNAANPNGTEMNWSYVFQAAPRFAEAALITLELSAWGVALSLLLGLGVAVVTAYRVRPLYRAARAYVELSRNTPLLIQLFFLYYGLPKLGIKLDGFTCGVIALVFLGGSYMAEALRAGLLVVPKGQSEAAKAIGLTPFQVFRHVVLPQAWAVALPAVGANVLFLVKETSVISAVAVAELMFLTKDIIGMDYKTNEALFLLLLSYLIILLPLSLLVRYAENRARRAKYGA